MAGRQPRRLNIYTDGASRKDGRGGWGFAVFEAGKVIHEAKGGEYNTKIGRMELTAAIEALRWVKTIPGYAVTPPQITMRCDAKYVLDGITEHLDNWMRRDWLTSDGKPVKNQDLWVVLAHLDCDVNTYAWQHVKGHSGVYGNELADVLAGEGVPPKLA